MFLLKTLRSTLFSVPALLGFSLLLVVGVSFSQALPQKTGAESNEDRAVSEEIEQQVLKHLRQSRPELKFSDLRPSPIEGVYEVKINGQLAFISADGGHIIAGEMYEVRETGLVNLQEEERQRAEVAFEPQRAELMKSVNVEDMVIYSPENGKKGHAYVFTDIDCGFCRRLHSQMKAFLDKGIEIRYLAFPRAGVNSKSAQKLATAWCAKDPLATMDDFKHGKNVKLAPCDSNPVADQYVLGQQVGVSGTPAIVLESGKLIPGAISANRLAAEMGI